MSQYKSTYYFLDFCMELTPREKGMGKLAATQAMKSNDATKVGAIIYNEKSALVGGHNHLSGGVSQETTEINEQNKSMFTLHAEMDAIINAQLNKLDIRGATMIVVGKCPCTDCAKAIVASGIKKILCPIPDTSSRWREQNNIALKILMLGGVEVELVKDLSGVDIGLTCPSKYIV